MNETGPDLPPETAPTSRGWFWWIPAATFLIGLLLGGIFIAVSGTDGDDGPTLGVPTELVPTPGTSGTRTDLTVIVPAACLEVADTADEVLALGRDAAAAIGELDARELQRLVNEMQQLDQVVRDLVSLCRQGSAAELPTPSG